MQRHFFVLFMLTLLPLTACSYLFSREKPISTGPVITRYEPLSQQQTYEDATHGNADAQYYLGNALCCGAGKAYDHRLAYYWLCSAAKQGHMGAQYRLGELYQSGLSFHYTGEQLTPFVLPKDNSRAYMWYSLAAESGYKKAKKTTEELKETLSIPEINRGIRFRTQYKTLSCEKPDDWQSVLTEDIEKEEEETNPPS